MRYLVFGAGGFIGKKLSCELNLVYPGEVAVIGANLSDIDISSSNKYECRINSFDEFNCLVSDETEVIYLLNTISPAMNQTSKAFDDNIMLLKYLEWARENEIKRTIFTSSGGTVYKNFLPTPISEDSSVEPLSLYGMSKLTSELYLKYYKRKHDLSYTILRVSNPYGPGQKYIRNQGLIPYVIECAKQKKPVNVIGDGSMVRDYIYIDDLISAVVGVTIKHESYNRTLNVGSGEGVSIMQVINSIEAAMGASISKTFLPNNPNLPHSNVLDISSISEVINWKPRTPFHIGINKYLQSLI